MKNPVTTTRERLGLTRRQLALAARVPYEEVWKCEAGYKQMLHSHLVQYLSESGYKGDSAADYRQWRDEVGAGIRAMTSKE